MISLFLVSCNKPDPNPELKDPIYADLNALLGSAKQAVESEKKALEEHTQALKDVIPQTGQIKYAQKRFYESEAKITRLEQEAKYLELKIAARKKLAVKSYQAAFAKEETWPDPQEWNSYQAEKNLRSAKKSWDSKARIEEYNAGNTKKAPASGGGSHH